MRIVLMGQAAFGEKVLQELIGSGEQVVGAYIPVKSPGRTDSLKQLAIQSGISVFQPATMRSKAAASWWIKSGSFSALEISQNLPALFDTP